MLTPFVTQVLFRDSLFAVPTSPLIDFSFECR